MDKSETLINLGQKIRTIRLSKNMTQIELANKIGKDHPSINKLEKGKVNPSYIFLQEVAAGLELEINDLIK
ncbi:MAG: helix-turn-helix transcriptional regulator [Flavobacteriia bacterium]|nr:helix-turn-helix transcriptional regulator [Flavobacteriia bacterium]